MHASSDTLTYDVGFWRRFAAMNWDIFMLIILGLALKGVAFSLGLTDLLSGFEDRFFYLLASGSIWLYYWACLNRWSASLGEKRVSVRAVMPDGSRLTRQAAKRRTWVLTLVMSMSSLLELFFPGFFFWVLLTLLDFVLMAIFCMTQRVDGKKVSPIDHLSKTYSARVRPVTE